MKDSEILKLTDIEKTKRVLMGIPFKAQDGSIIKWTEGQIEIINTIIHRRSPKGHKRIHIMTTTQYGKSASVAAGVLIRASMKPEKWAIVAGTKEKARIIMEYVSSYAIDHAIFRNQLELEVGGLERLKRERSRERLTFKGRGEVRIYSADAKNKKAVGEALMGFGSPNVIEDESALIDDEIHTRVMRMLGASTDNFLCKIGNPFNRNHFLKSSLSDDYYHIFVNWQQAIEEGRLTKEFIDEMRKISTSITFRILYEVQFPDEGMIDEKGYMPLLTESEIRNAFIKDDLPNFGDMRIGVDVAAGGDNYTVFVLRSNALSKVVFKEKTKDTMTIAGRALKLRDALGKDNFGNWSKIFVDKVGVGKGVYDRCREQCEDVIAVSGGEKATDVTRFFNKKAENYWRLAEWVKHGGKLFTNSDWYQIMDMRYKIHSDKRIKLITKEELLSAGVPSPDVADALAMTFQYPENPPSFSNDNTDIPEMKERDLDPYL